MLKAAANNLFNAEPEFVGTYLIATNDIMTNIIIVLLALLIYNFVFSTMKKIRTFLFNKCMLNHVRLIG